MSGSWQDDTTKLLVLLVGGIVLISLLSMGGGFLGAGGMMGGGMLLWPLLLLGVFVWFLTAAQNRDGSRPRRTAMDELRERFARGDISEEEFERRKETLQERD
jgi:putative membrane protein